MPTPPPPDARPDAAHPPTGGWFVRLLGGLELQQGALRITRLPSRAHVALLARLALAPQRAHAREEVIELLWPGVSLDAGRNRLRQVLSTLKSVLEPQGPSQPVVLADRVSLRVAPGALDCDVPRFEQLARSGRHDEAAALYRGELLPGYYDEWIDDERLRLAALHDRLRPGPSVAPALPRAPAAAPVPPNPGLTAMARTSLPHYLTPLFGVDDAAARLRGLVLQRRLVTVLGPGGSGKTRLAVESARALAAADAALPGQDAPFDRVVFVPLGACTTAAQALDALMAALGADARADLPLQAAVAALAGRQVLLVLDNAEQLQPEATAAVAELLARLPQLHGLVTSRRPLALDGEHEFPMAPLALPADGAALADAAANPALALFVDRARAVRADFHLGARNLGTLVALLQELEGLPLAIELAASRLRSLAPADLLQRLRAGGTPRLSLLARGQQRAGADPRHASMQQVVAWSWAQLGAPAQRLLAALTVLRAPFTATAAMELADAPDAAADAFDELLTHCLLRQTGSVDDTPRFWPYEPVREFALTRLDDAAALAARQRLRAWARLWVQQLPPTPSLPALRAESANLVAAFASAAQDGAGDDAVALLQALARVLEDVNLPAEGLAHAHAAVLRCADASRRAQGLSLLAQPLFLGGQMAQALDAAEQGLAGAAGSAWQARALHTLARVRWRSTRRADDVQPLIDQARALEAKAPDPVLRAGLLALQAFVVNSAQRDLARGEDLHGQALALWMRQGNQHAINSGRYNLAVCAHNAQRHDHALALLEPVLASARELQDHRRISQALNVQGNAFGALRQWHRAVASYRECLQVAWAVMAPFELAYGLWNLPPALAHARQPERAVQLMAFAVRFWRERFGELGSEDRRTVQRVRRLAQGQLAAGGWDRWWQEGELLTLPQAFALALAD